MNAMYRMNELGKHILKDQYSYCILLHIIDNTQLSMEEGGRGGGSNQKDHLGKDFLLLSYNTLNHKQYPA